MSINKVLLIGNVGRDPEVRTFNERKMATFSLATTDQYRTSTGEKRSQTEWHSVTVFGNTADFVEKYVKKGSQLFIEGKIRYVKRNEAYFTNIQAEKVELVGARPSGASESPENAKNTEVDVDNDLPL